MASTRTNFMGAKLALFVGSRLLVLHRDDKPGLLWPGFHDLPGGGREGCENPVETVLRETREEFSIVVPASHLHWGRAYTNSIGRNVWFFVGQVSANVEADVVLGEEGQGWSLMSKPDFLALDMVVPQFKSRLDDYIRGVVSEDFQERPPAT